MIPGRTAATSAGPKPRDSSIPGLQDCTKDVSVAEKGGQHRRITLVEVDDGRALADARLQREPCRMTLTKV
jgi:hypothetical protein